MLSMWCKKIDFVCKVYCVSNNSVLKYGEEDFEGFSNNAKTTIHVKSSKRAKEADSLNQFINKSKEGNLGLND